MEQLEREFRSKKMGILKYCVECLSFEKGFLLFSMMCVVPIPTQRWFEACVGSLKSPATSVLLVASLIKDPHAVVEAQLLSITREDFWNQPFLQKGGNQDNEKLVRKNAWNLNRCFCGELAISQMQWQNPPWSFLSIAGRR